jgi:hypothetical protein
VFDQALTNGLLAILATNWPDEIRRSNGQLRSASELLAVINTELTLQDGIAHLPTEERATECADDSTLRTLTPMSPCQSTSPSLALPGLAPRSRDMAVVQVGRSLGTT